MASRQEQLKRAAIFIVADGSQPNFYQLASRLQYEAGASLAEANRTILELLGRHALQTTMSGGIVLAGQGGGGGSAVKSVLESAAAILGIIAAILAIWQGAVFGGALPGPGPLQIIFPTPLPIPTGTGGGGGGVIDGPKLGSPHATISGDCTSGYTIKWSAVSGAEKYQVRVDDHFRQTVPGTRLKIPADEVMSDQEYTVIATALQRPQSDPSNTVIATKC